jgi:L-serine deaminase
MLAMNEIEGHSLLLDQIIETIYRPGFEMQLRYKETSHEGLALNIIEC